jgi:hypothetical protein
MSCLDRSVRGCKVTLRRLRQYRPAKIVHHKDPHSLCIEYNISIVLAVLSIHSMKGVPGSLVVACIGN